MSKELNYVTYQVALTEANVSLIDKINTLLIPGYGDNDSSASKDKPASKGVKLKDVKDAVKAAKKEHGEDFVTECLESVDAEGATLAKAVSAVDPDDYVNLIALLEAGAQGSDDDLPDDDDDDLDDDDDVSVDDVKAAVKAYAKENSNDDAREMMGKVKCKNLAGIAKLKEKALTKLHDLVS